MMFYREFNELGIPVFGLHGVTDGRCECLNPECTALYKHPKNASWQHTPVWDDEQIEIMELTGAFNTGYGVLCNDLIVVDIDARNGGIESYEKLINDCPDVAQCGFIVETGSGGGSKHLYFKKPKEHPPLNSHLGKYKGIDFKVSGFVVGAGSLHVSGNKYRAVVGTPNDIEEAPQSLISLLKATIKPKRASYHHDGEDVDIAELLDYIDGRDYSHDDWLMVGMAIHEATKGTGFELWTEWSKKSPKSTGKSWERKWNSFGNSPNPVTVGTLVHLAKQGGWKRRVEIPELKWERKAPIRNEIDLSNPPYLVGRIAKWINSRSKYPRENIGIATAIMAVSAACGLRYRGVDNATANMFMFCVAGSGTGKESIIQSYIALMQQAGIVEAVHGGIISEQEVCRNVIDHQASFYTIDEFGETLAKIQNARKKGSGSSHLEGLIGALMSIFSKANGSFLIPQTHKKRFKEELNRHAQVIGARIKNNEAHADDEEQLKRLMQRIEELEKGINEPYVNILGFTAPTKFNGLMDEDLADSGFFARALIVRELDDNPRAKDEFNYTDFKEDKELKLLGNILHNLFYNGHTPNGRIERYGNKITLPYSDKVKALLKQIDDDFWNMGEEQKEKQGFVAYTRRGGEMVNKLALILSASEGEIKEDAVLWAYEFVKKDMQNKILLTSANVHQKTGEGLISRILTLVDKNNGLTGAVIANRLRTQYKKEDVEKAIKHLEENKQIKGVNKKGARGKQTVEYFLI